jgi:hypothetical protein
VCPAGVALACVHGSAGLAKRKFEDHASQNDWTPMAKWCRNGRNLVGYEGSQHELTTWPLLFRSGKT